MPEFQITTSVGVTMNLGDYEFLKPYVSASFKFTAEEFAGMSEEQIRDYWQRLWDQQINPQVDDLIAVMSRKAATIKPAPKDQPAAPRTASGAPPEGAYS